MRVLAIKWMCKPRARCFRTLALLGLPNFSQQRVGVARVECGAQSLSGKVSGGRGGHAGVVKMGEDSGVAL